MGDLLAVQSMGSPAATADDASRSTSSTTTLKTMNTDPLHEAARLLGARGGKAPKRITDADRQRRRDWARGLAAIRASKRKEQMKGNEQ